MGWGGSLEMEGEHVMLRFFWTFLKYEIIRFISFNSVDNSCINYSCKQQTFCLVF